MKTVTLYRHVGPAELELIRQSGFKAFTPRLEGQPYFYPVLNRAYAEQIAREWNVRESGSGFVTEFDVDAELINRYERRTVGEEGLHEELWIPAEDLDEFNQHIVGLIRVVASFF